MSDTPLLGRPGSHPNAPHRQLYDRSPGRSLSCLPSSARSLISLPFDILLSIAKLLEPEEVINLQATCIFLRDFIHSRAVWLAFAANMLDSCQPLPLVGFETIKDLRTRELSRIIRKGRRLYKTWTQNDPKLITPYKRIAAPEDEDIVWLSPITSKYILCCTRTGKVLCWDIDSCERIAEWSAGADWEIWKCRVEFDERVVYFAMAKRGSNGLGTDFELVALHFPGRSDGDEGNSPFFTKLARFSFPGHVISVYLLDPSRRFLSAYIWIERTNRLGLYVLLDWSIPLYVFLDTGLSCEPAGREWSCIGYDPENVVIHTEEEVRGSQFFYPYSFLQSLATSTPPLPRSRNVPVIPPPRSVSEEFIPTENPFVGTYFTQSSHFVRQWWPMEPHHETIRRRSCTILLQTWTVPHPTPEDPQPGPDDPPPGTHLFTIAQHYFSIPLRKEQLRWWYIRDPFEIVCCPHSSAANPLEMDEEVELEAPAAIQQSSAEWAAATPEASNAAEAENGNANVVGAGDTDVDPEATQDVTDDTPIFGPAPAGEDTLTAGEGIETEDVPALLVSPPDTPEGAAQAEHFDDGVAVVPLIAVDFGCAVWLEYVSYGSDELRVRYVTFPPVDVDRAADGYVGLSEERDVHTLEIPPEINLRQVCHIGMDQAQGTVIFGMRRTNVFVLRYR